MKKIFLFTILILIFGVSLAYAASPVVFFSDLTSGPKTGGQNNKGAFVTIVGKNFGATQGEMQDVESLGASGIIGHNLPSQFIKLVGLVDDFRSGPMHKMHDATVRATKEGWDMKQVQYKDVVCPLLVEAVLCLWDIKVTLLEVVNTLESIVQKIRNDWQNDSGQTHECKPN